MLAYKQGSKIITVFKLIITIGGKSSLTISISNKTEKSVIIIYVLLFITCESGIGYKIPI